ncbi:DUF4270 domain-containing protein [Winogradskyella sp. PE311]|uniref:DUF4270 domain-containing protein n=1 Tax=Winogradskyella sp. PE311 TaxID=3366943 RepID=UPI003980AE70
MKNNKFAFQILSLILIVSSFIACDKDFTTLESDIINDDVATNFDIISDKYNVISYTDALGPVQTNALGLNSLGVYDDVYGRVTSSFVTQLTPSTLDPVFGEEVEIDSVVLTIPYFAIVSDVTDEETFEYDVDSVIGRDPIKLNLYESNYFLRDFDPEAEFSASQNYFSNKSASSSELISDGVLEGEEIIILADDNTSHQGGNIINISDDGFTLTELDEDGVFQVSERLFPGIRLKLDPAFWQSKIIDQEENAVLVNQNNFSEYFRGIYFKTEAVNDSGSFLLLNIAAATSNITIHYSRLTTSTTDDEDEREQISYAFTFGSNRVNFFDNNFINPINDGDPINGDSRLYLKGGEGSTAKIKLFNGDDLDDDPDTMNAFEIWKNDFVETDTDGNFVSSKRLVNEANLVFYVDRETLDLALEGPENEPNRIYLYDVDNKIPLTDFFIDVTNNTLPLFSKNNHLGPLQRVDDEPGGNGVKYKLRITEHINNLLLRDSTNVELGLAVSLNVNLEEVLTQRTEQTSDGSNLTLPVSSINTPRGTVLFGNNIPNNDVNSDKKVFLEIYYTEPN